MRPSLHSVITASVLMTFINNNCQAMTAADVFDINSNSVVTIYAKTKNKDRSKTGAGVTIRAGEIVTNCHIIDKADDILVKFKAKTYKATLRSADWNRDICSLHVLGLPTQVAKQGSSITSKIGQKVYAIGSPKGLELTFSEGIISGFRETTEGRYIQTTAAISDGSSGGGLFDANGRLIGLTTFYVAQGQQLNFAIPVEWIEDLQSVKSSGQDTKSYAERSEWHKQAQEIEDRKDYGEAELKHGLAWSNARPNDSDAWLFLGNAYINSGADGKLVLQAYQRSVRLNPSDAEAWEYLGRTYSELKNNKKAIESHLRALYINPNNKNAWQVLAIFYRRDKQFDKAVDAIKQAIRIDPTVASLWADIGHIYLFETFEKGSAEKAVDAYRHALNLDPEKANYWDDLGASYRRLSKNQQAIQSWERALKIDPYDTRALSSLGFVYSRLNNHKKAIEYYERHLQIASLPTIHLGTLGSEYKQIGETNKAMDVYKKIKEIDPKAAEEFLKGTIAP